jgi:hypothetical protein
MIVAITGGREYEPSPLELSAFLEFLADTLDADELHHGASGSVDWGVSTLVRFTFPHIFVKPWPVDTRIDGPWPAAGCRRNGRMLEGSHADVLARFKGNRGTRDCTAQARGKGVSVLFWDEERELWRFED